MAQHRYKILSICVPYLFYPVPKKAFDSLNKNELSICPKDFITVYVVIDTEGSDKSDIFTSLTEAKNKCLEKNNKVFNESKIPRLTLDLPSNWRQYIVKQNKPKLECDIDDTILLNEISNAEKNIILSLLEERKKVNVKRAILWYERRLLSVSIPDIKKPPLNTYGVRPA
ncbi:hypothetical protein PL78_15105 [Yersinia entomophaga]|uniref:Uncharacterized protein n=2 Tax=Enterobacterales TaxID=91347 RepID=A0ABN4PVV7_YERET|nr:hypothetical protein [Yersinia entomophaga]ANI31142.1 hypothetical protein PL78_15105 [Yersinia entomophaga]